MFISKRNKIQNNVIASFLKTVDNLLDNNYNECKEKAIIWFEENIKALLRSRYYCIVLEDMLLSDLLNKYSQLKTEENRLIFSKQNLLEYYPEIKLWKVSDKLDIKHISIIYTPNASINANDIKSDILYIGFNEKKEIYVKFKIEDIEHVGVIEINYNNSFKFISNLNIFYRNLKSELEHIKTYMKELGL